MASDLATFALAFAVVWGGLAAYFAYLHALEVRLAREVEALRRRFDASEGTLK